MKEPTRPETDEAPDWFYPEWAAAAEGSRAILVLDTDSALGRYSVLPKALGLKDLARAHGHLCDGLVTSFIQIKAALERLFPSGVVDRTDLRAVASNSPCRVDAVALMTGARINFQTLRLDHTVGDGFIIQKGSTGEAWAVHLKPGVFPEPLAALERRLRALRSEGDPVSAEEIDAVEEMADAFSQRLLNARAEEVLDLRRLDGYRFMANDLFGSRGDIVNKDVPRSS